MIRNKRFLYIPGCINLYTLWMAWIVQNRYREMIILFCFIFYTILHIFLLAPWSRVLLEKLTVSQLVKKFPHFMERRFSLQHSQVPATFPYPELIPVDQSMSEAPVYIS